MMVPLILSEIQIESAWQLLLHVVEELGQIEYLSGQHDWDMDEKESRLPAADYHQLTGKLTSNNVRLAHHQSVCSFVLSLVDFIGKELDAFKPTALVNGQAITDWEVQVLVDHNAYLKNWTHCLSIQFTDLQIRTQGMTQAVCQSPFFSLKPLTEHNRSLTLLASATVFLTSKSPKIRRA